MQPNQEENTESGLNSGVRSLEQFLQSRQSQRTEIADLLKEIRTTLNESSGPVFSGLTFAISLLKGLPENLIKKKVLDFIKECDDTAELYNSSQDF